MSRESVCEVFREMVGMRCVEGDGESEVCGGEKKRGRERMKCIQRDRGSEVWREERKEMEVEGCAEKEGRTEGWRK